MTTTTTASKETPVYGLVSFSENRFYLLEENFATVKMIQHLLMNQHLFSCVEFTENLPFGRENMSHFGCSKPVMKNARADINFATAVDKYFIESKSKIPPNESLKGNLDFLYKTINKVEYVFDSIHNIEREKHLLQINGVKEFKRFMSMILPTDQDLKDIADSEVELYEMVIDRFQDARAMIIKSMLSPDYTRPLQEVKAVLEKNLKQNFVVENVAYQRILLNLVKEITS